MKVTELKALAREHELRFYSQMRKADIIELISNKAPEAPDVPLHTTRIPTQQEMDTFEQ